MVHGGDLWCAKEEVGVATAQADTSTGRRLSAIWEPVAQAKPPGFTKV
jgi:hypothetical protein